MMPFAMFGGWADCGMIYWKWLMDFKNKTNNFRIMRWEFEEPASSVKFLDLTISIENNKIVTKTYQKSINHFQYIMPQSAHPPNMAKGIITI